MVLQRQIDRPRFTPLNRTILAILSRAFDPVGIALVILIAKPATLIGWHTKTELDPSQPTDCFSALSG